MTGKPWPAGERARSRQRCGDARRKLSREAANLLRRIRFQGWIPGTLRRVAPGQAAPRLLTRERPPTLPLKPGQKGYPSYRALGVLFGISAVQARAYCKGLQSTLPS